MRLEHKRKLTCFSVAVMAMGLLLWARFILVTGHPKTVIANPASAAMLSTEPAQDQAPADAPADRPAHTPADAPLP